MTAPELLPPTFPTDARARAWSAAIRRDLYDVVDVVESTKRPGRYQVKVRRLTRKAAVHDA